MFSEKSGLVETQPKVPSTKWGTLDWIIAQFMHDIFDKAMADTITRPSGVLHIRDDFNVFGKDNAGHDKAPKTY